MLFVQFPTQTQKKHSIKGTRNEPTKIHTNFKCTQIRKLKKKHTHNFFSENLEQCKYHPHFWVRPAAVNPSINGRWLLVQILLHGTLCSFFLSFTFLVAFFGLFYVSLWFLCFVTLNTFNEEIEFAIVKGFTKTGFFVFNSENELKQVILSILWRFITGSRKINFPGAPQGSHGER